MTRWADHGGQPGGATRAAVVSALVVALLLVPALTPARAAGGSVQSSTLAVSGLAFSGHHSALNPVTALADAEQDLRDAGTDAARLEDDLRRARESLADARTTLTERIAEREQAQHDLERAERDVDEAAAAVQRATDRLSAITRRLTRLVDHRDAEDGRLKVEAREAYKDASGRLVAAAVALNTMMAEDDPTEAVRTADRVSQLAAKRAAEVHRITVLADGVSRAQAEQAGVVLVRHHDHGLVVDRRNVRRDALEDARSREADQQARVRQAEEAVAAVETAREANERRAAQLRTDIAAWQQHLAALRTSARRAPVPAELARYGNGHIPARALTPIGVGQHRLWGPAAGAFKALRTAASADGVAIGVTDSYRSYSAQVSVAGRKGLYAQGGLAARPGSSEHGWGLALDLDLSAAALRWMRTHAGTYGFVENTPREPWHWVFTARP